MPSAWSFNPLKSVCIRSIVFQKSLWPAQGDGASLGDIIR
jgi:hypothetical protein